MKLIERNHCVISGREDLEFLHSFKEFPVFMGCVTHPPEEDIRADMNWWISKSTGCLQLNPLIPLEILYSSDHGACLVGCTLNQHHKEFSEFILKKAPKGILEIGGGSGLLAEHYISSNKVAEWTVLEPNPSREYPHRIHCIREFFSEDFLLNKEYDAIVHSHVFEHMYEPDQFMKNISERLTLGKHMFFSIPKLKVWLKRGFFNALNFEHTFFLTEDNAEYFLEKYGFEIIRTENFMANHSIFYECIRTDKKVIPSPPNNYLQNKNIFDDFLSTSYNFVDEVMEKASSQSENIFIFGGHIFSQYLLACGLSEELISAVLDNNTNKQNKRLYGTNLSIKSPKLLQHKERPIVILRAGPYNQEIKTDILKNINPNVVFWE